MVDGSFNTARNRNEGKYNASYDLELGTWRMVGGILMIRKLNCFGQRCKSCRRMGEDHMGRIPSWKGGSSENNYTHV